MQTEAKTEPLSRCLVEQKISPNRVPQGHLQTAKAASILCFQVDIKTTQSSPRSFQNQVYGEEESKKWPHAFYWTLSENCLAVNNNNDQE